MGKLFVTMFMTIDQVMQGPGGLHEDTEGGFSHSGWQAPLSDAKSGRMILDQIMSMDALLIGRKTYDIWSQHWPKATDAIGDHFNGIPRYVASQSLTDTAEWPETTIIRDVPTEVAALKDAHASTRLWGSSDLLQTLLELDLVDGLDLFMYSITLGSGKRVFRDGGIPAGFQLTAPAVTFDPGTVFLSYRRAGDVSYGDIDSEG